MASAKEGRRNKCLSGRSFQSICIQSLLIHVLLDMGKAYTTKDKFLIYEKGQKRQLSSTLPCLTCCVTFQTLQQLRRQHLAWFVVQQFWPKNNSVDLGYQLGWHTFLLHWISSVLEIPLTICFRESSWRGALHFFEFENDWKSFCDYVTPTSCACKLGMEVLGKCGC